MRYLRPAAFAVVIAVVVAFIAVVPASPAGASAGSVTAVDVTFTEGNATAQQIGTFTGTAAVGAYSVTVTWGDGATSAGSVTPAGGGTFNVSAGHAYADEGTNTFHFAVTDSTDSSTVTSNDATATVGEGDFGSIQPVTFNAVEGAAFSGTVLNFTDEGNPLQTAGDWTATIDWGDGTPTTTGTVSGNTGGPFA